MHQALLGAGEIFARFNFIETLARILSRRRRGVDEISKTGGSMLYTKSPLEPQPMP